MQNIFSLFLLSNILSVVKSFSLDYMYTNNLIYSNYFVNSMTVSYYCNYFNSNNFNSNQLSYNINSNYFNSNTLETISSYKYNSFNNYLSIIKTMPSQSMSTKYYSLSAPTMAPTSVNTFAPTMTPTFAPTMAPTLITTLIPTSVTTLIPSKKQTEMPTIQEVSIMSFDTKLTFNNYDSEELDIKSQQVIIIATANSMNISESYIKYIGSTLKTRRLSIFKILGFNIIITLKTTIPLLNQRDPSSLYSKLTTNIINSVNSGLFTSYLISASNVVGITSFANVSITSIENDDYVITEPDKHYIKKKEKETHKIYTTIYIIFGVLLSVYLIMYFVWLRRKYLNKNRQLRSLFSNITNPSDITIRLHNNS